MSDDAKIELIIPLSIACVVINITWAIWSYQTRQAPIDAEVEKAAFVAGYEKIDGYPRWIKRTP